MRGNIKSVANLDVLLVSFVVLWHCVVFYVCVCVRVYVHAGL